MKTVFVMLSAAGALVGCGGAAAVSSTPSNSNGAADTFPASAPAVITTAPPPTPAPPFCGFGTTNAVWDSCHQVDSKYPNESGYLPFVSSAGGGEDQFASVDHTGGRVVGWIEAFSEGTLLATAEQTVKGQVPPDTQQTATFQAHSADGSSACVLVNYQSAQVAQWLGGAPWGDAQGVISVDYYQVNADGSGSTDTSKVNTANIDIAPATASTTC